MVMAGSKDVAERGGMGCWEKVERERVRNLILNLFVQTLFLAALDRGVVLSSLRNVQ